MNYIDQLGRTIAILKRPRRIISLVPSQTELLVSLGLSNHVIGITKFCIHPKELKIHKTIVGGTKHVDFEKIKNLNPDIILCNKEENTKEIVEYLEAYYPVHVSDIVSIDDTIHMIRDYGAIFGVSEKASKLSFDIQSAQKSFEKYIKNKPIKKVAYFIWKKPWMVAGNTTFIDWMLKVNSFENVFGHKNRYPEIDENELCSITDIDIILLSSEPYPFSEKHRDEIQNIIPNTKVVLVDGTYFSWHGSRLEQAFSYFRTLHQLL